MKASHVMALAIAGASAFLIAVQLGRGNAGSESVVDQVVAPTDHIRAKVVIANTDVIERLNDSAIHDPFAPLHLPAPPASASLRALVVDKAAAADAQARKKAEAALKARERWMAMGPPLPPPPPVAPPLPFTAVGAISGEGVTDGKLVAFIKQQDQLLLVRAGDTVGQTYRVDSVTSQRIEFTYLPLMQRQVLALAP